MNLGFETLGNATLVFYDDQRPVLATDPWLIGTCYFGSWGLDRPLTPAEFDAVRRAGYVWISHGHPDHLHGESLALLSRETKFLLPEHYTGEIAEFVRGQGFPVEVMPYREWRQLSPRLRCLSLDNENQDAILVVEAGDCLILNLNDSPLLGDRRFVRKLVRRYDRKKTYAAALCATDADMLNFVDHEGRRITEPAEHYKPGTVWALARQIDRLGIGTYVCSSSQHTYIRSDSAWANPYRITWADIERHWTRPEVRVLEPFVIVDLQSGEATRKHPSQASDFGQVTNRTGIDNYDERLNETEWTELFDFFRQFETIHRYLDYLDFTVGGEQRRLWINPSSKHKDQSRLRGIGFYAPRHSLCEVVKHGYFDDMMIGNFMKTELHNTTLYPYFTPLVCKLGGTRKSTHGLNGALFGDTIFAGIRLARSTGSCERRPRNSSMLRAGLPTAPG